MTRIFIYEGREFPDLDPNMPVEDVKAKFADFAPELSNADVKESKKGEDTIYEFVKKVGVKG